MGWRVIRRAAGGTVSLRNCIRHSARGLSIVMRSRSNCVMMTPLYKSSWFNFNFYIVISGFMAANLEFALPFKSSVLLLVPFEFLTLETYIGVAVTISLLTCNTSWDIVISGFVGAISDFIFPFKSYSIVVSPIWMLDPWNIGVAVGILLPTLQTEISFLPILWPPSWFSHLRFNPIVLSLVPFECWTLEILV